MNLNKLKKIWLKRMIDEGCFFQYEKKKLIDSYIRDIKALMKCK